MIINLSKESSDFLVSLRMYLVSSGKNEREIEEVIDELEDHLFEAEKNNKNVDEIIGITPKEYMEQIAGEMPIDFRGVLKTIFLICLGAFSYILMGDALTGGLSYSLIQLIGYPLILLSFLSLIVVSFKYLASNNVSKIKEWVIFGVNGITPLLLFLALLFFNGTYNSPTIQFGGNWNVIAIVFCILVFVGMSISGKSWIWIILPILLYVPEILINMTNIPTNTKVIIGGIGSQVCIALYLLYFFIKEKKKEKKHN
ncbi:hypothetical protein WAK64_05955 [Bacillus spongiae]|uniref:HAAS transmembrane region domain-containing protein n=1 Tax=Bacillus spongiae TaxID=2683610 RepID=A0ABU8HBQ1_9BACI